MKVCHMTSAHESTDVRIFRKECVSLAAAGYETYLVARGESREERGVHVVGVGPAPEGRLQRMTTFARTVYRRALELDADLYHIHDPELLPYARKLKRRGKKVIFDSHENAPAQIAEKRYLPGPARRLVSALYKAFETFIVRKLDAVIIPCTIDGVDIFAGRAKRACFITNYPILSEFRAPAVRVLQGEEVCYVGSLSYSRGVLHLIQGTARAQKRLLLIGSFVNEEFEKQIRSLPEFSCVTYLGEKPNTQIPELTEHCLVGANTLLDIGQYHHADTFGVKVCEYMALGMPVLTFDSQYMRSMMEKYQFGLCVRPDDPAEIAAAITYLCDHPDEARRMGENGLRAVKQEFNWKTQESKLLTLYREIFEQA